jgi:hypothetical protein
MLVYGGKNDLAFNPKKDSKCQASISLDDIMLFEFETSTWIAVLQMGLRPEARWNTALSYSQYDQKLYLFGGSS